MIPVAIQFLTIIQTTHEFPRLNLSEDLPERFTVGTTLKVDEDYVGVDLQCLVGNDALRRNLGNVCRPETLS